jgi:Golgi complex component 7 (COG7)
MMDRTAFVSQSFDAKKWLNDACAAAPDGDQLDKCVIQIASYTYITHEFLIPAAIFGYARYRYLQEMEMKLQLAAEDAEQHLYDTSMLISSRVPGFASEISRLRVSLAGMTDSVDALSAKVSTDERQCSAAAGRLKKLDLVKSRMLAARKTLQVGVHINWMVGDLLRLQAVLQCRSVLEPHTMLLSACRVPNPSIPSVYKVRMYDRSSYCLSTLNTGTRRSSLVHSLPCSSFS